MGFKVGDIVTTAPRQMGALLTWGELYKVSVVTKNATEIIYHIYVPAYNAVLGFPGSRLMKAKNISKVERLLLFE